MERLSSREARSNFSDTLNRVAYGHEHLAIQRPGKESVYLIPSEDYQLLQQLIEAEEDRVDIAAADLRMADPNQERVPFEEFFSELGI